ncbi:protein disulfide-isomerase precursor, putative [Entamoeba invadens IP1]|uniref:protein disulfide-isomerase precursor, putative n=1 Tax=Entamoeba invadens IP1 TaxID=370355 RepID=UPI0002C3D604|nr:protein disulfide-isomerase precursor, putative [Entamoeba invadens IP1]ELP85178.1 protein disulfide-isomerase precursor, putative [Entamoeba invadens IP1]|eukprot:XP_004184524.1 protein disulfide-isomerase precursor, putative [Entamoeba invadens IP1]
MLLFVLLFVALSQAAAAASKEAPKEVPKEEAKQAPESIKDLQFEMFTLNNEFYGSFIDHEDTVFVKYYAPWCGHCKALKPIYEQLAKEMHNKLKFAEVNCEDSKEICEKEEVQGFPTLILFRKGRAKKVYGGERNLEAMKNWLESAAMPPVKESNKEEIEELKKKDLPFLVVRSEADDPIRKRLEDIVDEMDYMHFYALNSDIDNFEIEVFNGDTKESFVYEAQTNATFEEKKFMNWANIKTFPLFHQVNMPLFKRIESMDVYALWYFYQTSIPKVHEEMFRKLAKKYEGSFVFFSFNKVISEDQVKSLHHTGNVYPAISIIHKNKRNIYAMNEETEITEESVTKYLEDVLSGNEKPTYHKSKPIPEEKQKEIYKLTGNNFDEFIATKGVDKLVIFCVERVEVCKYFLSTPLKRVSKRLSTVPSFKVAWIDASTDDVGPEWNLNIVPKLYLVSEKDGETKTLEMTDMPSEENTMKFLHENALYKFEMPAPLPEEKKEEKKEEKEESDTEEEEDDEEEEDVDEDEDAVNDEEVHTEEKKEEKTEL